MTCEQARQQLAEYLAERLEADEREAVAGHLANCADCRAETAELGEVWSAMESPPGPGAAARKRPAREPPRGPVEPAAFTLVCGHDQDSARPCQRRMKPAPPATHAKSHGRQAAASGFFHSAFSDSRRRDGGVG